MGGRPVQQQGVTVRQPMRKRRYGRSPLLGAGLRCVLPLFPGGKHGPLLCATLLKRTGSKRIDYEQKQHQAQHGQPQAAFGRFSDHAAFGYRAQQRAPFQRIAIKTFRLP